MVARDCARDSTPAIASVGMSTLPTNAARRKGHTSPKRALKARDHGGDEPDHPLHDASDTPTFASAIRDGTITRPSLRRQLHAGGAEQTSSFVADRPGPSRKRSYSETTSPTSFSPDWTSTPGSSGSQSVPEVEPSTNTREVLVHEVEILPPTPHLLTLRLLTFPSYIIGFAYRLPPWGGTQIWN